MENVPIERISNADEGVIIARKNIVKRLCFWICIFSCRAAIWLVLHSFYHWFVLDSQNYFSVYNLNCQELTSSASSEHKDSIWNSNWLKLNLKITNMTSVYSRGNRLPVAKVPRGFLGEQYPQSVLWSCIVLLLDYTNSCIPEFSWSRWDQNWNTFGWQRKNQIKDNFAWGFHRFRHGRWLYQANWFLLVNCKRRSISILILS